MPKRPSASLLSGLSLLLSLTASLALVAPAAAQTFPSRPVRFIVPFPPGAINDFVARTISQKFAEVAGQPALTDNRGGGGTMVGTEFVIKSPPDGHTLLLMSVAHAINPTLYGKMPYDAQTDLAQITLVGGAPFIVVVNPAFEAKTMKDLIAIAKARPGQLHYGSSGTGGGSHLATEMLNTMAGIKLVHVPYKGAAPAITDVLGGQITMTMGTLTAVGGHLKSGKLRGLAVSSRKRSSVASDLPTIAESCCSAYDATPWWGVATTAATPQPIVRQLNGYIVKILRMPEVVSLFTAQGVDLVGSTPEEALAHLKDETQRWSKVVKDSGAKPE
jgi:tripartite-type tricarboxylate transporter receptor subunit TctC